MSAAACVVVTCLLVAAIFVINVQSLDTMEGDIFGPPLLSYGRPCKLYKCPPNHYCLVDFKQVGQLSNFPKLAPRAVCRPDSEHGCSDDLCSTGQLCLATQRTCDAIADPKPSLCNHNYACVSESQWFKGLKPIKPGMYAE